MSLFCRRYKVTLDSGASFLVDSKGKSLINCGVHYKFIETGSSEIKLGKLCNRPIRKWIYVLKNIHSGNYYGIGKVVLVEKFKEVVK